MKVRVHTDLEKYISDMLACNGFDRTAYINGLIERGINDEKKERVLLDAPIPQPPSSKREIIIPLAGGHTLRCGPGVKSIWGGYLCVSDPTGSPIQYWDSQEWGSTGEEAEEVIGAIFAMAVEYAHMNAPAQFVAEVEVLDPDSQLQVEVSIFKLEGGPMMGVDTAFLDNTDDPVFSPYDRNLRSLLVNAPGYTDVEDEEDCDEYSRLNNTPASDADSGMDPK